MAASLHLRLFTGHGTATGTKTLETLFLKFSAFSVPAVILSTRFQLDDKAASLLAWQHLANVEGVVDLMWSLSCELSFSSNTRAAEFPQKTACFCSG